MVTGHDRDDIGMLLVPDMEACARFAGLAANDPGLYAHPGLRAELARRLGLLAKAATGSSNRVERALILTEPPSLEAGELTDKGSINQRAVLTRRKDLVAALYAEPPGEAIIRPDSRAGETP